MYSELFFPLNSNDPVLLEIPVIITQGASERIRFPLDDLMKISPGEGTWELRKAIAMHLASFRDMQVTPGQIIIGAGTEYMYSLLIQLLGRDKVYCVEDPGYSKIARIYASNNVKFC